MQFIRLPKPIDIAERELPELVVDWVDTWSVQNINTSVLQELRVNMLVSWVIACSKGGMPHRRTFRNCAHWTWAIWDLSNHDLFLTIFDPGSQQWVTLSLESIITIPFQARASDVKMPKLRQHSSNLGMPYFIYDFGTFQGICDQADKNRGALFRCTADNFSNITYHEIQWPGMLITRKKFQVHLVGFTNDWHNGRSGRKLILCIALPITRDHLAVDLMTLRVCEADPFKIEVCLKRKMCLEELDTFENIPVV